MLKQTLFKFASVLALAGAVVATSPSGNNDGMKRIGILQLAEHQALDDTREGFIARLEELGYIDGYNVQINYFNAQGDQSNLQLMSQQLVSSQSDLVFAIATRAAQAIANETTEIPILTGAVTSLVNAGLVESNERPGGNVSGTSDFAPLQKQLELLRELAPNAQTLGLIYNSSEPNSVYQIQQVEGIAEALGFETIHMTVTNTNDVAQNFTTLAMQVDAVFVPTDNTMASAAATVGQIARERQLPVMFASVSSMRQGGLATIGIDYFVLGNQAADMAIRVFEGEDVATMPVEFGREYQTFINRDKAEAIGIHVPAHLLPYLE
ncbi:MAG: ABC transporter substrate-binding protein [Turicibacter sp.]|nr:ABC transporter substrate-binding protein [Turicibacter sp.]